MLYFSDKFYFVFDQSLKQKKLIKYSIKDSQDKFIIHIKSAQFVNTEVDKIEENCMEAKTTLQPLIIVVGCDMISLTDFYVYYRPVMYKFQSFLKALDCLFKIYQVFHLAYPKENELTMTFIQQYFYEIYLKNDVP